MDASDSREVTDSGGVIESPGESLPLAGEGESGSLGTPTADSVLKVRFTRH